MESPQSAVSPFNNSLVITEAENPKSDFSAQRFSHSSRGVQFQPNETRDCNLEDFIGFIEVYIHQARDIHNICIYQKQDVYAKLCLTSDPEKTVSTKIINGGGRNPVFNEDLRLNVRTAESSLKCEIWMLSRVKNYLEDQLLGFALVPLSDILIRNGKLMEKEFSLSSTDLFHSPAGFVQLSLSYRGASPEVLSVPSLPTESEVDNNSKIPETVASDFNNIEFPDPKIVNENDLMVSQYFEIQSTTLESENQSLELGVSNAVSKSLAKHDSPLISVSTNGSSSHSESKSTAQNVVLPQKEKAIEEGDGKSESSKPVITAAIDPEQEMVQQEIVDMYMKSMQQFTESLAKMKLPMDIECKPAVSGNSSSDENSQEGKKTGSRVFYGSRAFF